jgi:Ca2+-binding RTX toxin-like protein
MSRTHNRRRPALNLELLEGRCVPTASAAFLPSTGPTPEPPVNHGTALGGAYAPPGNNSGWIEYNNGVVRIFGTNLADTVLITYQGGWGPTTPTFMVTLSNANGFTAQVFASALVSRIDFAGYDGNDTFNNITYEPTVVEAGAGNDWISGGYGNDDLRGRAGNDTIIGGNGNDKIYGGTGNDNLDGGIGNDIVAGNDNDDTMHGGDGNDLMSGGLHNDIIHGNDGDDDIFGDSGNDWIYGEDNNDELNGGPGHDDIYGGDGNDELVGDTGDDYLLGGDGNDDLVGNDGDDIMHGSDGHDWAHGGDGDDWITGGDGNDDLYGADDDDLLEGGEGDDYLNGGSGDDELEGGDDNDELYGSNDDDFLRGGDGDDYLNGGSGDDTLYGDDGNDELQGGSGDDGLFGALGHDIINGGTNADRILTQDINGAALGMFDYDSDDIQNLTAIDAVIRFANEDAVWSAKEIEEVDTGLARLHRLTSNTALLKDPDNPNTQLMFYRQIADDVMIGNFGTNTGTSVIFYDLSFSVNTNTVAYITVHELGHFWDEPGENSYVDEFREHSGWTTQYGSADPGDALFVGDVFGKEGTYFVKAETGNWWYDGSSEFVTDYARTNPMEDFAETFSAFVMGDDFYRNENDTPDAPQAKLGVIADWIDSL